ncbi:MAG: glycosyl hydrolase, partial [Planctomycetota bacterium]
DDGRVHVTHDGGGEWEAIDAGLEPDRWISRLEASRFDEGTIYCAQNGKRHDDFRAYLWRSTDFGRSWRNIGAGIPCGPINVVREDPTDPDILYVGTDLGVYVTLDGARTWEALAGDLPTTFVHDLVIHPRDDVAIIATHGRGMYALDVRPLRGEEESVEEEGVTFAVEASDSSEEQEEEDEGE